MTKISELTVADLRGARDQIERHLKDVKGLTFVIGDSVYVRLHNNDVSVSVSIGRFNTPGRIDLFERAEWDADWTEFMDKVWKRISQIPSKEVREIRSVMSALGGAIEVLDKSTSEFATELTARLKGLRDEAGARLITYQGAE